jgi:hypothetical protein
MLELKVTLDNLLTFVGLLFVTWQIREANKQSKLESQIRLYDINRELISLGFSKPELFEVLKDESKADPTLERWYLQLWLNQLSLFHSLKSAGVLESDYQESVEHDMRDMFGMPNMRRHWQTYGKYYPASFQESVNNILHEAGHKRRGEEAMRSKRGAQFFRKRRVASSRNLPQPVRTDCCGLLRRGCNPE